MKLERPTCEKCGGRMVKFGRRPNGRQRYRCLLHRRPVSPKPSRPACKKCGGRLCKNGHAADGSQQYLCPCCRQRSTPNPNAPCCVRCCRPMWSYAEGKRTRLRCPSCRASCYMDRPPRPRPRVDAQRPQCRACGHPKAKASIPPFFKCNRCYNHRRALRTNPDAAVAFLAQVSAALPGYLTPDERDDAAQSIMLDVLARKLPPVVPASPILRRYAAEARGMTSDRFKFISLSEPMRDGREFGESLAA